MMLHAMPLGTPGRAGGRRVIGASNLLGPQRAQGLAKNHGAGGLKPPVFKDFFFRAIGYWVNQYPMVLHFWWMTIIYVYI